MSTSGRSYSKLHVDGVTHNNGRALVGLDVPSHSPPNSSLGSPGYRQFRPGATRPQRSTLSNVQQIEKGCEQMRRSCDVFQRIM